MNNPFLRLFVVMLAAFGITSAIYAQAGADSSKGSLNVTVLDTSGAVIPGATVTLTGSMGSQKTTTNERGEALFYSLVPGTYSVKVSQSGFASQQIFKIPVQASQRSSVQAKLEVGKVTETVQVAATAALVDTTSTTVGATLQAGEYQNLPIGRNVTNLFYLAPGVANGGGTGTANPSISGASGLENVYVIDGINTTDTGYGAFGAYSINYGSLGTGVNFDFVKEVQVKTGGFEAQYGQAMGGIINVVTNSGGNEVHGAAYFYDSPGFAEGTYDQPNDVRTGSPLSETYGRRAYDMGFNLGGPFVKNRFFWYGSFNPSYQTQARLGPPNYGSRALGIQDRKRDSYNFVGKLNFNLTDNHRIEATAFGDPSRSPTTVQGSLVRDNLDSASKLTYGDRNWAVKYTGVFGATTLLNGSFAWSHSYFVETPVNNLFGYRDYSAPKPTGSYTLEGGLGYIGNNQGNNKQYNVMITRNVNFLGSHQFDLGYSYNDVGYDVYSLYSGPQFALPTADGIDPADVGKMVNGGYFYKYPTKTIGGVDYTNVYRLIRGNFSDPNYSTDTRYQDAFVQDAWQPNRFLTVKAGIRWEEQKLQGATNTYVLAGNWAPRIGFIIDPTGSRKTKIFANFGRFFEQIPQDLAVRAMSSEQAYFNGYYTSLPPAQGNLIPGSTFFPSGVDPTIIYGGTKAGYQNEISGGIEREIAQGFIVRASFTHRSLVRGLEDTSGITVEQALAGSPQQYVITNPNVNLDIFQNAVTCVDGTPNCTNGSGYTDNSGLLGPDGKPDGFPDMRRVYNAFELSAERRFGNKWSLMANYRLAKLFGNYEGSFRNDNGQSDPNITSLFDFVNSPALADQFAVGVLPTDRRHIVNVYGNYMLMNHLNIGLGWTTQSGTPISKLDAHPAYGNAGEIPVGGRGAYGRTPVQNYLDMNLAYDIPITDSSKFRIGINMFNLFNSKTITEIDQFNQLSGGLPNADFLKPLDYHRPFYAQFMVRYEF